LRVRWTRRALEQFDAALSHIALENPQAAQLIARRLSEAEQFLAKNPAAGRPGRVSGTREWVVKGAPYLVGYLLQDQELVILAVLHSKQHWPGQLE